MLLCCILDVYLSFLFVCRESLTLVSDPTSCRFIRWLLFQTFIFIHIYIYIIWKSTPFITGVTTTGIIVAVYFYLPMYVYCCCYAWIFINPFVWKYLLTWVPEFVPIFCTCLNDLCGVQYCQITCLYCFLFLVVMSATISA